MKKNVASQKWRVFAWHRNTGVPATGIAATITGKIDLDDAGAAAITDTNPTEAEDGFYDFDLTQAETNAYKLAILPESNTSGVGVIGCPRVLFTEVYAASDGLDAVTGWTVDITGTVSGNSTHTAANVASLILTTPANKLATDTSGYVTFNNTSIGTVATLTNAPPDSAGVGTLLTRVPQVISMAQIGGAGAYFVEVLDATGAAVAPAATALSTATWTATKAGYLDAAISTRQATVTNLANVVTMAAQFSTMIVLDGAVYDFTAAALAAAPSGSGLSAQEVRDAMKLAPTAGDPDAGSVDKHLDDLLEDTGTTLPTQIAALDISAGTGTYACTWTVDDGSTALEGAKVSFWLAGVLRGTGTTDASGEVSMSLDAGTYTVAISLSGYTFASTTHTVSAMASTWTKTFSMTAIVFSPTPDADQVTAWGYVYGPAGTVESGATIVLEQRTAGARQIYDNAPRTLTADGSGLVSAVVWADGSEYRYRRGTGGEWSELFAPEDDEDPDLPNSYRLPGWLGAS